MKRTLRMKAFTLLSFALCSLFVAVAKAKVVVPANECGGSWTSGGNGNCYFLMSYFEYFQSRLECQEMCIWSLGGKLGSIHSDEEQELIVNMIQNSGVVGHKTWTGGDCNDSSGEWGWDDESAWDYERWATNGTEPNGCGCMYLDTDGAWRSEDCTIKTADWNCVCKKTL